MPFKERNEKEDQQALIDELDSPQALKYVANLYGEFTQQYSGDRIWVLQSGLSVSKRKQQTEQLRRFIHLAIVNNAPIDIFMKAQFELLIPYFKDKGISLSYPTLPMLCSDKAVHRYELYEGRVHGMSTLSQQTAQFYKAGSLSFDVQKAMQIPAQKFYERLLRLSKLNEKTVLKEFELMARAGMLTNIYIYSHPLAEKTKFTTIIKTKVQFKLIVLKDKEIFKSIKKQREAFEDLFENKKVSEYV